MENSQVVQQAVVISAVLLFISGVSVHGQITTPCTSSMVSSFTPCFNFITGSNSPGAPSSECCDAIKELTSTSRDCTCLIINAGVPVSVPINRTLAISLPRACNMPGVPIQCKATGSPLPSPGPASFGTASPPAGPAESPLSPTSSKASTLPPLPSADDTPIDSTPAFSPTGSDAPTEAAGKPAFSPSAATYTVYRVHLNFMPILMFVVFLVY